MPLDPGSQKSCVLPSIARDTAGWGTVGPDTDIGFGTLKGVVYIKLYHSRTRSLKNHWNKSATSDVQGKLLGRVSKLTEETHMTLSELKLDMQYPKETLSTLEVSVVPLVHLFCNKYFSS